ncbi:MAG: N-acetyltransferase [Hyphomicrobiales bacterium]|nr:N-acetyltransferase [Hyphomicrobiales bacterium]MCP4999716.1 N-acetyltransferase [Hyphomicrobiales bacterium]
MKIRPETPADRAAIHALHVAAFDGDGEARLVDRLRADGDLVLSLVAIDNGQIIGHVALSPMTAPFPALGLAPVAVSADYRRRGTAAALINRGLDLVRDDRWKGVFVLGEPSYYERFGFSCRMAEGYQSPYSGPYFMALSLGGDRLPARAGRVDYAAAFSSLA